MVGPILGVLAVSYLIQPLEFPRYVLASFVGLFALAAFGAASPRSAAVRVALAALIIGLSLGTGALTFDGGSFAYTGLTATTAAPITITVNGGAFLPNEQMTLIWDQPNKVAGSDGVSVLPNSR